MHGRGLQAVSLFQQMIRDGVAPDDVVFIGLLSACSHSRLVQEAVNNNIYKFVAGDMHHNQHKEIFEMVDEMGREMKRVGYVPSTSERCLISMTNTWETGKHSQCSNKNAKRSKRETARKQDQLT
ncbi:hypothetical protein V6N13_119033 [Hibiscus sabdariffa]